MLGQVANARGSFAPLMWAPIANNLVVIAVFAGVLIMQNSLSVENITDGQIQLLGWGTTLGIVVQALILIPVVKRSGIRLRPIFGVAGLGKSFSLAGWTLVYVLISQIGYLITVNVATSAAVRSAQDGISTGVGFTALRPGDISLSISGLGVNASDLKIQNFSLSTDIGRDPIQKLGSKFAFSREITFPVTVTASVEAIIGDIGGTDNLGNALSDIVCNDGASYDLKFNLGAPSNDCNTTYTPYALQYILKGAKLDSQAFSSAIGDNKSVTLGFSAQIGGPNDTNKGLFINNNVASA
jgi:hypothetical protein